uniref:Uncharacterized protein AlNc14C181G8229 n=1 Tax=Albugo laibachii Nc14 TaxID=890382 RepID=F0WP81_9STRA|nr:conserved hypothetical protein [Albugo laibachii Nc14]|eukprot:CCA23127.1 conserved hypothetical protein [Albugo laibachii Nc14]
MNTMSNTSNLHAANATSIVGSSMPIPIRSATPSQPSSAASMMHPSTTATIIARKQGTISNTGPTASESTTFPASSNHVPSHSVSNSNAPKNSKPNSDTVPINAGLSANAAAAASPFTSPGVHVLNLSGRWSLDRNDSDSTNDYLEAMGLPLIARQAADKLDLMVIINQTPGDFVITRRTRIFSETKHLKLGQEVILKNNIISIAGDASQIKTTTQLTAYRGLLMDIRSLDEKGRMKVELTLVLPDKPPVTIQRYFKKTSTSTSLENLPPFDMSAETAESKRKR